MRYGRTYLASALALLATSTVFASPSNHRSSVIVTLKANARPDVESKLKSLGFDLTRHLSFINAVSGTIPTQDLDRLASLPQVQTVTRDQGVAKDDAFTTGSSLASAAEKQFGCSGTGIGVAVLDSGVTNVNDFNQLPGVSGGGRLKTAIDFTGKGPNDQCGHGTHVAGIIAGNGLQSTGAQFTQTFYGCAPTANLINVRVLDQTGAGSVANVIAGVQWVVANASKYNIRVLNMSLGHPVTQSWKTDPLNLAVEAAWRAGIVVVCAAGNNGRLNATATNGQPNGGYGAAYGSIECPGNDPYVITVGATKQMDSERVDDQIATYSSRGPTAGDMVMKPDLVAPGNHVVSTEANGNLYLTQTYGSSVEILNGLYQENGNATQASNQYMMLSGTSMAAPVVSGCIALMLSQQPKLTPDTVKARLMVTADKWLNPDGTADPFTFGAGYVNVQAAMGSTLVATSSAKSPSVYETAIGTWYFNLDPSIYGQRAMWGTGLTDVSTIYGQRAMWGTAFDQLNSSRAMWGTGSYIYSSSVNGQTSAVDCTGNSVLVKGE